MPATKYYPPPAFAFSVGIASATSPVLSGSIDAGFQEVTGIDSRVEVQEVVEGGVNAFVHQLPGATKHSNLVLKRGYVVQASALADWVGQTVGSSWGTPVTTRTLGVFLLGPDGKALVTWTFLNAWPVKWEVGAFNATDASTVLTQALELSYTTVTCAAAATGS